MKILMVSQMIPYLPCHDGFRLIPANLMRSLSKRHEIHLIAPASANESEKDGEWARQYCRSVEIVKKDMFRSLIKKISRSTDPFPAEALRAVRSRIKTLKPDILHLEGPMTATLAPFAPEGTITVLSAHDSIYLRHKQVAEFARTAKERDFNNRLSEDLKGYEKQWYGQADRVAVTSQTDLEALSSFVPVEKLRAIPNGVDFEYFTCKPAPVSGRIVFTGNMSWGPNEDASEYFANEIFPGIKKRVSNAEFWIVGAEPSSRVMELDKLPGVHVTGRVDDIRELVWSASVYASPLRFGAGCKNKILEAMALGAPIIATTPSLTGTPLEHDKHLLIADERSELSEGVCKLLNDKQLGHRLYVNARDFVVRNYSWDVVAGEFEKLYTMKSTLEEDKVLLRR